MANLGDYVDKYEEARGAGQMLRAIAEKLRPTVNAETDFRMEAQSQQELRNRLSGTVKIAVVFYASEGVLIMEWLHGRTGTEVISANSMNSASNVLDRFGREERDAIFEAYACMIFEHGFFQMDAHPGNFMALDSGGVAILDFGQCCRLSEIQKRRTLAEFVQKAPRSLEQKGYLFGLGLAPRAWCAGQARQSSCDSGAAHFRCQEWPVSGDAEP